MHDGGRDTGVRTACYAKYDRKCTKQLMDNDPCPSSCCHIRFLSVSAVCLFFFKLFTSPSSLHSYEPDDCSGIDLTAQPWVGGARSTHPKVDMTVSIRETWKVCMCVCVCVSEWVCVCVCVCVGGRREEGGGSVWVWVWVSLYQRGLKIMNE